MTFIINSLSIRLFVKYSVSESFTELHAGRTGEAMHHARPRVGHARARGGIREEGSSHGERCHSIIHMCIVWWKRNYSSHRNKTGFSSTKHYVWICSASQLCLIRLLVSDSSRECSKEQFKKIETRMKIGMGLHP